MSERDEGNQQIRTFPTGLHFAEDVHTSSYPNLEITTINQTTRRSIKDIFGLPDIPNKPRVPRVTRNIVSQTTQGSTQKRSVIEWYPNESIGQPFTKYTIMGGSPESVKTAVAVSNPAYGAYSQDVAVALYRKGLPARAVLMPIPFAEISFPDFQTQQELLDQLRQRLDIHMLGTIDPNAKEFASLRVWNTRATEYNLGRNNISLDSAVVIQATKDANIMLDDILTNIYPEDLEKRSKAKKFLEAIGALSPMMQYYVQQEQASHGFKYIQPDPFTDLAAIALAQTVQFDRPQVLEHIIICDFTDSEVKFELTKLDPTEDAENLELHQSVKYGGEISLPDSPYAYQINLVNGQVRIDLVKGKMKLPMYQVCLPFAISQDAQLDALDRTKDYTLFGQKAPITVGNPMTGDMYRTTF